jgi:hypothetical protein
MFYYSSKIDGILCLIERCSECDFYHKKYEGYELDSDEKIKDIIKLDGI